MEELYPEIQLADGPPRANGVFYYEAFFESGRTLEQAALKECEMLARKIAKQDHKFERLELTEAEALALFPENAFKQHFVQQALRRNPNALLTAYRCGPFVDFCAGPHLPSTKRAKSFILTRSGSHEWTSSGLDGDPGETVAAKSRGGLTLQRVYGVAKTSSEALAAWQAEQKILQQRSHRMIGQKQHLFMLHRSSPGGPFFLPHGVKILRALKAMLRCEYEQGGYDEVVTPLVYSKALWEQSGHWDHYSDDMYFVSGGVHAFEGGEVLETGLKPMSCPAHCLVYRHTERSWRSLPLRIADFTALHRNESSGALSGLTRVRQFHQDDGHIFCTDGQVGDEVRRLLELVDRVYTRFGFDYELKLSTRPEKSMGDDESWENAEACLRDALDETGRNWELNDGDGAFYGPKIDIALTDALDRRHQTATIQLDFQMPKQFDLEYTTADGKRQRPVIIHRAVLGSLERFFAILCEHTAGKWPLWMSPRQVMVCPVGERQAPYAREVCRKLRGEGLNAEVDCDAETLSKRLTRSREYRFNYVVVVGEKEEAIRAATVTPRGDEAGAIKGTMDVDEMVAALVAEIERQRA